MLGKLRKIKILTAKFFSSLKENGLKITIKKVITKVANRYGMPQQYVAYLEAPQVTFDEGDYAAYVKQIEAYNISRFNGGRAEFVDITKTPFVRKETDTKVIAWYLPQYYQMEVNNKYHGQGFTEWTNSSQAFPLFTGHYQPHIPYDVGYYDLTNLETMKRQAELAKMYGVYGFCFHWYWFSGERTMEVPCELLLEHKEIDMKFCFDWATENWTSAWDGGTKEIIFEQKLNDGDDRKFMDDMLPYMLDDRYIKIDGRPILCIYRCDMFTKARFRQLLANFRKYAREAGFPDLYIMLTNRAFDEDVADWGADALAEFPPTVFWKDFDKREPDGYVNPYFKGTIYDMGPFIQQKKYLTKPASKKVFRAALVGFDNTARRATTGCAVIADATPENYKMWLKGIIDEAQNTHSPEENIVFVNSWNEWAEGSHLEPDMKYGYGFLQATKEALEEARSISTDIVQNQWAAAKEKGIAQIHFYVNCVESMGDIIACEPVARYLKNLDDSCKVHWIVRKNYLDVVKYNPYIDECITVECLGDAIDICDEKRKSAENAIVDLHFDGRMCSKTRRVHSNKNNPIVNEKTYFNYGPILSNFALSAGLPALQDAPKFYIGEDVKSPVQLPEKYVIFHCKSAEATKDWLDNSWNVLAHNIMNEGYDILEIGFDAVIKSHNPRYHDCTSIRDLQQIAAIIRDADCFFGVDSGFAHLANCLGVYGILIFGKYKNFDYPMVYTGGYNDGSNADVIYANAAPAATVDQSRVFDAFLAHIRPNGIQEELAEQADADQGDGKWQIMTTEDITRSERDNYLPFPKPHAELGGEYGNITYAQYGDDMQLINLFRQIGINQPSYLDIGAHHPYVMSNTAALYERGSRGINVEADRSLLTAFVMERNEDKNVCAAVSDKCGIAAFYHIAKVPGCSTLVKHRAEAFVAELPQYGPIDVQTVVTVTLDQLVSKLCKDSCYPDFLNLNIGGNEYDVLNASELLYSNGPAVIDVEVDGNEHEKFKEMMAQNGYFFYIRLGVNEIYIREKYRGSIIS